MKSETLKNICRALTGVAQLAGHWPTKQKVVSSIPGQGMRAPGLQAGGQLGHLKEATNQCFSHIDISPSLSSFPTPLSKINK